MSADLDRPLTLEELKEYDEIVLRIARIKKQHEEDLKRIAELEQMKKDGIPIPKQEKPKSKRRGRKIFDIPILSVVYNE